MVTPFHPKQVTVRWVNRNIAVRGLNVKFSHEGPFPQARHRANNLINSDVMKSKLICANPIIDTSPPGGRQIHNETPFAWLAIFRNDTKTTNLEVGKGGGGN